MSNNVLQVHACIASLYRYAIDTVSNPVLLLLYKTVLKCRILFY